MIAEGDVMWLTTISLVRSVTALKIGSKMSATLVNRPDRDTCVPLALPVPLIVLLLSVD